MKEDFNVVYKFPLKPNRDCGIKVMTNDNKMAFDWLTSNEDLKSEVLDVLNGTKEKLSKSYSVTYECGLIKLDNKSLLRVRGWGYLTGIGGLGLNNELAARFMDEFGNYIKEKLSK